MGFVARVAPLLPFLVLFLRAAMSLLSSLTIAQLNPDGSVPVPEAPDAQAKAAAAAQEREAQFDAMQAQMKALQEVLAMPLKDILAEHDKLKKNAAAWDAYAAMWMLGQRAMRRVAMDLAAQQGVSEDDIVKQALAYASDVLNNEGEDLGGSVVAAQLEHIGRHKPFLRQQFK